MTLLIQSSCVRNSSNIYIIRVNVMYLKAIISSCIQSVCKYLECFLKQRVDLGHTRALVHQIQLNGLQHCSANCFHSNVLNNTTMMNILSSTFFKFFFFFLTYNIRVAPFPLFYAHVHAKNTRFEVRNIINERFSTGKCPVNTV